jgi:hydroxyacylglutathione hydrolase
MIKIIPIPAFSDNYIWLLQRGAHAVVVDPGDAAPVIAKLKALSLQLDAILITHHHSDHIDGVNDLLSHYSAKVYAPKRGGYHFPHQKVEENSRVHIDSLALDLSVMELPGHTLDHVAYYGANCLFCGDTLFGGGCGRLFEGTPAQMFNSLQRLANLPETTEVYCAHEYTLHNLKFALELEPDNAILVTRLADAISKRQAGEPTLPSTIKLELATNPFLRCNIPAIQHAAGFNQAAVENTDPIETFAAIRTKRNHY